MKREFSTEEAAKKVGIHRVTLQNWCLSGKIKEPRRIKIGGSEVRMWTDQDVKKAVDYKNAHYAEGRGRKPKAKR